MSPIVTRLRCPLPEALQYLLRMGTVESGRLGDGLCISLFSASITKISKAWNFMIKFNLWFKSIILVSAQLWWRPNGEQHHNGGCLCRRDYMLRGIQRSGRGWLWFFFIRTYSWDWGNNSSVDKMFVVKVWAPKFRSSEPASVGIWQHMDLSQSSYGEVRGRDRRLPETCWPASLTKQRWGAGSPVSNQVDGEDWHLRLSSDLHMYAAAWMQLHSHMCVCTQTHTD